VSFNKVIDYFNQLGNHSSANVNANQAHKRITDLNNRTGLLDEVIEQELVVREKDNINLLNALSNPFLSPSSAIMGYEHKESLVDVHEGH
jgi:hypothetical protein